MSQSRCSTFCVAYNKFWIDAPEKRIAIAKCALAIVIQCNYFSSIWLIIHLTRHFPLRIECKSLNNNNVKATIDSARFDSNLLFQPMLYLYHLVMIKNLNTQNNCDWLFAQCWPRIAGDFFLNSTTIMKIECDAVSIDDFSFQFAQPPLVMVY